MDDNFIKEVGSTIESGTSALFLLVQEATGERVVDELKDEFHPTVLQTSLWAKDEARLREAFGAESDEEG